MSPHAKNDAGERAHAERGHHESADVSEPDTAVDARARPASAVARLHEHRGNQLVQRMAERSETDGFDHDRSSASEGALRVAPAWTPAEREAERIASTVVERLGGTEHGDSHTVDATSGPTRVQRSPSGESRSRPRTAPDTVTDAIDSPGQRPDPTVRRLVEDVSGESLSQARIHTDATAHRAAQDVGGHAFTVGSDIAFGRRAYTPRVLAHELAHVAQQSGTETTVHRLPGFKNITRKLGFRSGSEGEDVAEYAQDPEPQHADADDGELEVISFGADETWTELSSKLAPKVAEQARPLYTDGTLSAEWLEATAPVLNSLTPSLIPSILTPDPEATTGRPDREWLLNPNVGEVLREANVLVAVGIVDLQPSPSWIADNRETLLQTNGEDLLGVLSVIAAQQQQHARRNEYRLIKQALFERFGLGETAGGTGATSASGEQVIAIREDGDTNGITALVLVTRETLNAMKDAGLSVTSETVSRRRRQAGSLVKAEVTGLTSMI